MRTSILTATLAAATLAACTLPQDDDAPPPLDAPITLVDARLPPPILDAPPPIDAAVTGNPGFTLPTRTARANRLTDGARVELGDADWTCLGTPSTDQPPGPPLTLSGRVLDFQTGTGVGGAMLLAFPGTRTDETLGTATSDAAVATRGDYTAVLAPLTGADRRYGFRLAAAQYQPTYVLDQYLDPATASPVRDLRMVSTGTTTALVAFIGQQYDLLSATVVGTMRDCAGHEVSNVVATVSSVPGAGAHVTGANTFYFSGAANPLPVRHDVSPTTNKDGQFLVVDVTAQATPAFIQVWGFRTAGELMAGALTLLAEVPAPLEPGTVDAVTLEPRRLAP